MRLVILGGGVAGLAAAFRALKLHPEWDVTIIEQASRAGGLAVGWKNDEFAADLGPHRIYTELPEIEALLPELIAEDRMLTVARRSELLLDGHFYQYPVRASELLRRMGPFRMTVFALSAIVGKLRGLFSSGANYEDVMSASFGKSVYRTIIEPYTRKVWKIEPRKLSAEVARVRVSAGNVNRLVKQILGKQGKKGTQSALNSFGYIKGGVEGLVSSLVEHVQKLGGKILLDSTVHAIEADRGDLTGITISTSAGEPQTIPADAVISTLPITDLVEFLQLLSPDDESERAAKGLVYVGLILVALVIKRPQFTPNSWIYFPEEQFIFNRAYEPRNFDPSMAPSDRTMAVFEVTARWDSDLWKQSDEKIIATVKRDVEFTGLLSEDEIAAAFSIRVPHTYPLYATDYQSRLESIFAFLRRFPNLVSTGRQGLFNHNNMDHSMLMGIRAAECVAASGDDAPAQWWYNNLEQFSHFRIVD